MKVEEAIKIIAEYMDDVEYGALGHESIAFYRKYHESLDLLVPVWEKIRGTTFEFVFNNLDKSWDFGLTCLPIRSRAKTLQEAACIATAKAISELKIK